MVSSFPPYVIWRKGGGRGAAEDCEGWSWGELRRKRNESASQEEQYHLSSGAGIERSLW